MIYASSCYDICDSHPALPRGPRYRIVATQRVSPGFETRNGVDGSIASLSHDLGFLGKSPEGGMTRSAFCPRVLGVVVHPYLLSERPPVRRMSVEATTRPGLPKVDGPLQEARTAAVRVFIVHEERLFAEALELVLLAEGITVDAIASPGPDLLDAVRRGRPHVVILGVDAPTAAEVRRGETIVDTCRTARVLLLASSIDRANVLRASRAGLHCIPKRASVAELVGTVRDIASGGVPPRNGYAPSSADAVRDPMDRRPALTPRELEVLKLVATGATGRSIARRLGITENTVRTHSQSILGKLHVHSRLEAAAYAMRSGLVVLRSHGSDGLAS